MAPSSDHKLPWHATWHDYGPSARQTDLASMCVATEMEMETESGCFRVSLRAV